MKTCGSYLLNYENVSFEPFRLSEVLASNYLRMHVTISMKVISITCKMYSVFILALFLI